MAENEFSSKKRKLESRDCNQLVEFLSSTDCPEIILQSM